VLTTFAVNPPAAHLDRATMAHQGQLAVFNGDLNAFFSDSGISAVNS
jgi:hypothetical protein